MLPPVLDDRGRPLDQIRIVGLTATGHHGVFAHERRDGQDFTVDVILHLDTRPAAERDDLDETVDYGSLSVDLADTVRGQPLNLIESLAGRLALMCLADPRVTAADVVVHKPGAPIPEQFGDVMVVVRRDRSDLEPERDAADPAAGAEPAAPTAPTDPAGAGERAAAGVAAAEPASSPR